MHKRLIYTERVCPACNSEWAINAQESDWYTDRGLEVPKRCPDCRQRGRRKKKPRATEAAGDTGAAVW